MPDNDLREIIHKAESSIDRSIVFSQPAADKLVRLSKGQPYMLHLVGKWSLMAASGMSAAEVTIEHVEQALHDIVNKGYEHDMEERYRNAVASSPPRESVLRAFAQIDKDKIHSSEAYDLCPDVDRQKAAVYLGHLRQDRYGAELIDRDNRYHEFRDALFKAYASATPRRFPIEDEAE